ncbi:MAG TPA: DUF1330 domain-containing protein [Candidatus Thermoplasmatota archaeon]|nr:DUF1330 domain-containing protein [Candidatus Thermoplasmatota archaeon]
MPAFVLVGVEVTDPEAYKAYRAKAAPTVMAHGGRYVARGGAVHHLEPGWDLHRTVILEFPSVEAAKRWYASPEYRKALPIRLKVGPQPPRHRGGARPLEAAPPVGVP